MEVIDTADTEWMANAPCKGQTNLFYEPVEKERTKEKQLREARAIGICAGCAVLETCLEYALANEEQGIWGGTTEKQRNRYLKAIKKISY